MHFQPTNISGCFVIDLEPHHDERGFFAETFHQQHFLDRGLAADFTRTALAHNIHRGTVRGLHFQSSPFQETKLVRCVRGSLFDVAVDLRRDSDTYLSWQSVTLSAANRAAFYIPTGCAHGYQTLEDDCEVLYQLSNDYDADHASGIRWDDPALAIPWPLKVSMMSARDKSWPLIRT